jgi:hypothetical protein
MKNTAGYFRLIFMAALLLPAVASAQSARDAAPAKTKPSEPYRRKSQRRKRKRQGYVTKSLEREIRDDISGLLSLRDRRTLAL